MTFAVQMQSASASNAQKSWMELTLRGFGEMARGETAEAARCWLDATAMPWKVAPFDPLYATGLSNAGSAHLIAGHRSEAAQCFCEAAEAWQRVVAGIETIDVPVTGASSSFHFRLAASDQGFLTAARRDRYRRLAEAGLAITQFNQSLPGTQVIAMAEAALCEILGEHAPEVRLLAALPGRNIDAIYAEKFAVLQKNKQSLAAALSQECAQVESAVRLTALLSPSLFNKVRLGEDAGAIVTNLSLNDV